MGWLNLIPIGLNLLTSILHAEKTKTDPGSGAEKKTAVMTAVGQTVQTVIQNVAPKADSNAAMGHISSLIDNIIGLFNVFGLFKHTAGA